MLTHQALLTIALVSFIVLPVHAESQAPLCSTDADCEEGEICNGFNCNSEDIVCVHSESCAEGQVCNLAENACPPECADTDASCAARCEVPNGYCEDFPVELCQADADCDEDKLCAIAFAPLCAEDDPACAQAPKLGCVDYLRFCGPDEDFFACSGQETCNADGRCVWTASADNVALSETVVIDEDKADRLREEWIAEIKARGEGSGCQMSLTASGGGPRSGVMALLVLTLSMMVMHRRRKLGSFIKCC
jgi:hypothetical protein